MYKYLLDLALILFSTKLFGLFTRRAHMPQVVGALVAGLILGPVLGIVEGSALIDQIAELGVIVLMFSAGVTTNIRELKNTGKAGFVVALAGVLAPLAMGAGVGMMFPSGGDSGLLLRNIFLGTVLTATSVSITVETLKEMGKMNTQVGNTILAAALIDDVLGLICLTIVSSFAGQEANVLMTLLKIAGFFVFVAIAALIVTRFMNWYAKLLGKADMERFYVFAFIICLVMAFAAEEFFGVADIIGAFAAGLIVGNTKSGQYIESPFSSLSFLLLSPVFFARIGLSIEIPEITPFMLLFSVTLIAVAVLSKLVGCGLGAKLCNMTTRQSIQTGLGMVCRGEVALIVANRGASAGLLTKSDTGPVILMIIFSSIITPIMLKLSFKGEKEELPFVGEEDLIDSSWD